MDSGGPYMVGSKWSNHKLHYYKLGTGITQHGNISSLIRHLLIWGTYSQLPQSQYSKPTTPQSYCQVDTDPATGSITKNRKHWRCKQDQQEAVSWRLLLGGSTWLKSTVTVWMNIWGVTQPGKGTWSHEGQSLSRLGHLTTSLIERNNIKFNLRSKYKKAKHTIYIYSAISSIVEIFNETCSK